MSRVGGRDEVEVGQITSGEILTACHMQKKDLFETTALKSKQYPFKIYMYILKFISNPSRNSQNY